ncbi:hypothetical protein [Mitsuokella sp.]|uniref:hypothetical protein n=1 Tax=Mitsuokella sp. TaxID=2049034 RepID=UPI003D7CEF90
MNFTKVRRSKARKMSTRDRQLRDWQQKSDYLSNHYIGVAPLTFYVSLGFADVSDEFSLCTMNAKAPAGQRMKKYCDIIDMLADSYGRDDAYVYPAFYLNSYPKEILLHSLRCLYLDLDYVTAASLRRLCEHDFYGHRPTFLVNSGNGVHLVYVLSDSLTTCRETKEQLSTIHRKLLQAFAKHRFKADMNTGLSHAYRVVSSKTKLGQRCTAYRIGGTHDIADLAASVGMVWNDTNPSYYKSEQTYEKKCGPQKSAKSGIGTVPSKSPCPVRLHAARHRGKDRRGASLHVAFRADLCRLQVPCFHEKSPTGCPVLSKPPASAALRGRTRP